MNIDSTAPRSARRHARQQMIGSNFVLLATISVLSLSRGAAFVPVQLSAFARPARALLPTTPTSTLASQPNRRRPLCLRMAGGDSTPPGREKLVFKRNIFEGVLGYLNLWPVDGKIVLNSKDDHEAEPTPVGWQVSEELRKSITALYGQFLSEDGSGVDYGAMRASTEFEDYVQLSYKLQQVEVMTMAERERAAFFINIYNSLLIHAICVLGAPADLLSRLRLYASAAYCIGGHSYALNDIENGVLRANRPGPGPLSSPPFATNDPRAPVALSQCDPRIHFALNCGARGCPPIRFYVPDALDSQLDKATKAFCASVQVDQEKGEISMSEIFKWYKDDFTPGDKTVPEWVKPYLSQDKQDALAAMDASSIKVTSEPYDWGLNSR